MQGRRGKVAILARIEHSIDQHAFADFRAVSERAGLSMLEPRQDQGSQAKAARVAGALPQAHADARRRGPHFEDGPPLKSRGCDGHNPLRRPPTFSGQKHRRHFVR